jgi:protease I
VQVVVASSRQGPLTGMLGGTTQADVLLNQVNVDNFNAVIFVGGVGALEYFNNPVAQNLARQAFARHKVLAAIGTAPTILANAGVLRGARATAYISEQQRVTLGGADYTGNPVEKDGLTVTATGPLAVAPFAKAILDGLAEAR